MFVYRACPERRNNISTRLKRDNGSHPSQKRTGGKNKMIPEKQKKFLEGYDGSCKGRYHIAYLAILGIAGGEEVKEEAIKKYGREKYVPDEMYPLKEAVSIIHYGMERGIPAERMGRMVAQSYKRSSPEIFDNLTHDRVIDLLLLAYSSETDVGDMLTVEHREPGKILVSRKDSIQPCEFFIGVVNGAFQIAELDAQIREVSCQWKEDNDKCVYEVTWDE